MSSVERGEALERLSDEHERLQARIGTLETQLTSMFATAQAQAARIGELEAEIAQQRDIMEHWEDEWRAGHDRGVCQWKAQLDALNVLANRLGNQLDEAEHTILHLRKARGDSPQ